VHRWIEKGRTLEIGTGLKYALLLQGAIAGVLIITDIGSRWRFSAGSDEPAIDTPVSPGDQVRRYDPSHPRPNYTDIDLPKDIPPRLEFTIREESEDGGLMIMQGQIADGDAARFEVFLSSLEEPPVGIAIDSPGGIVDEAIQIGTKIRDQGLDTRILPGTACLSSCPYVVAGGVERSISLTGVVGLHQHYYETPGYMPAFLAVEDIQRSQGETMGYLIEMGIDPGVMIHSLSTPPNDIYVLVESELIESRMATEVTE